MSAAGIFAGIGAAVAVAGTIGGIVSRNNAINAANNVKLPKFQPIDIAGLFGTPDPNNPLSAEALGMTGKADLDSYFRSKLDWGVRNPALATAKEATISNVLEGSEGKLPPAVNDALKVSGVDRNYGTTPFEQARNLRLKDPLQIEKNQRNAYTQTMGMNPQIQIGGTGADVVHAMQANTEGSFTFSESLFGNKLAAYNAAVANNAQTTSAALTGLTGAFNAGQNLYSNYSLSQALNSNRNSAISTDYYNHPANTFALQNPQTGQWNSTYAGLPPIG